MKKLIPALFAAIILVLILFFGFSNKPPRLSAYDVRREKLIDSLQYPNAEALIEMHENMLETDGKTRSALLEQLSDEWLALGQPSIAADYLRQLADNDPSYENYMRAGSALSSLVDFEQDEQVRVNVIYGARYSFEKAQELKPGDIDARIGLATVLVASTTPMEGIMMLRQIDNDNPGNIKANLELGKFAVMSGQYDKAIERFDTVLEKDSLNLQALYMKAQSYLGMRDTAHALGTLERTITLTTDSMIVNQLQQEINNLK